MSSPLSGDDAPTGVDYPARSSGTLLPWFLLGLSLILCGGLFLWLRATKQELETHQGKAASAIQTSGATVEKLKQAADNNAQLQEQLQKAQNDLKSLETNVKVLSEALNALDEETTQLKKTYELLETALKTDIRGSKVALSLGKGRVAVSLNENVFADAVNLSPNGKALLSRLGAALRKTDEKQAIAVAAHTDEAPLPQAVASRFSSEWEFSAARAAVVARYLVENAQVPGERVAASGYGRFVPKSSRATLEGAERIQRLDILLAPILAVEKKAKAGKRKRR